MFCPNCGKNVPDDSKFCDGCGFSFANAEPTSAPEPAAEPAPAAEPVYAQQYAQAPQTPPSGYGQAAQPGYMPPVQQTVYAAPPVYPGSMVNLDAPLGVGSYMMMSLVQCIPLVGFIMLLVWAFSRNANTNKKNYARAALIWWLIGLGLVVLSVVVMLLLGVSLGSLAGEIYYY